MQLSSISRNRELENLFFELIQVALGQRVVLCHTPSLEEWQQLFDLASKQALLGVCFHGVELLHKQGQTPPKELLYEWIGATESINQSNDVVTKRSLKVQEQLGKAGIRSSILKGQGVAQYYGNELKSLRQSGDIDVYVDCGFERTLKFAQESDMGNVEWDYKHLHLNVFPDTEVEVHYRVEVLLNLCKNAKLQKWCKEYEGLLFEQHGELVTPTTDFNRFYILLHIYRHFLYEGVGLRQLMDYYFVLLAKDDTQTFDLQQTLKDFGMMRFARGVMWVLQEVFVLDREYMICEPLEREGRFILKEVMAGGNFGHHDERISGNRHGKIDTIKAICKHNWHLLRHYPSEVMWPPVWFVWHKCWKIGRERHVKMDDV